MKALLFANTDWYLLNFRIPLLQSMQERGDELVLVSPPGPYSEELTLRGFQWLPFTLSRSGTNIFSELGAVGRLYRHYRKEDPDLFVHFTIKCVIYGSIAAKMLGKKVIINSIDGLGYVFNQSEFKARLINLFIKPLYRYALKNTLVLFQNPDDRDTFLDLKLVREGQFALVQGVGLDMGLYTPVSQDTAVPVVLFAGRLLYSKGVAVFVEAARRLKSEGVAARFVLAGRADPGNPESLRPETIEAWVKEGTIEDWGWRDDMPDVYQQAHIFCLPAIYREGMPKSLMEAGASGMPAVASDVAGCRDIVRQGQNGFLVPPNDVSSLVDALRRLIADSELRDRMGKTGREIVEEHFSAGRIVQETLAMIDAFHLTRMKNDKERNA